jgi:hypothetical protein
MDSNKVEKITMNSAFGMTVSALLPIAKTVFAPIAIIGREGTENLISRARTVVQYAKEEIEDIVAEAQFERLKKQLDKDIAREEGSSHVGK